MRKKIILFIVLFFAVIICLPLIINEVIFENSYITKVSYDGWASFLGSYIGGVVGGIVTLITMVTTVKQTQQQIIDANEKDKYKERVNEANEVAKLIASYLANVEIYCDKRRISSLEVEKLYEDRLYYNNLLVIWKECVVDRYFKNYRDYLNILRNKYIDDNFAKIFFENNMNIKQIDVVYNKYVLVLEEKIEEYNVKISGESALLNEIRQKKIIGNIDFLLLEIKLTGMNYTEELWKNLQKIHNQLSQDLSFPDIQEIMLQIKEQTRVFIKKYIYY